MLLTLLLLVSGVIGASDYRPSSCPLLLQLRPRQRCGWLPSCHRQGLLLLLLLLLLGRGAVRGKAIVPAAASSSRLRLGLPLMRMCGAAAR